MAGIGGHAIGTGAHRAGGEVGARGVVGGQDQSGAVGQQPGQPLVGLAQFQRQAARRQRPHRGQVGKQRLRAQPQQRGLDIGDAEFDAVMPTYRRAQVKMPFQRTVLVPVMGEIAFHFPFFLVYPG